MKKKLLSVLMAGALVATSSVNAFAAPNVTGADNQSHETEVRIEGNVTDNSNQTKPGTLSVTVPTTATFTVDADGGFTAPTIRVENSGQQDIDVFAYEFIDVNKADGINIVGTNDLTEQNRSYLSLSLEGNHSVAYFKTETNDSQKGVYTDAGCSTPHNDASGVKVAKINSGDSYELRLAGETGKSTSQPVTEAKQDAFTLKLKIAKSTTK